MAESRADQEQEKPASQATVAIEPELVGRLADLSGMAWFQVDGQRRITAWSPEVERITGFRADEVMGLPCVVGIRCQACLGGCAIFEQGEVRNRPLVLHRHDGESVQIVKSGEAILDDEGRVTGAIEVMRLKDDLDVARAAAGGEVLCSDPRVDRILASLGRLGVMVDLDFRIRKLSARFAERIGVDAADLVGRPLSELLGDDLFGEDSAFRRAVLAGQRREGWRAHLRVDGGVEIPVSLSAGRVEEGDGLPPGVFVMMRPDDLEVLDGDIPQFEQMVARSAAMQRIFRLVELLRDNDATVLITGESGTGKELVARALHARSHRASQPFVAVNCGALPPDLLESELFGHVRGAFTGALRDRPGRFEVAEGGTLFLDEVGDLPLHLQVKLLRVLQDRTYERVGDSRPRTVDVRVVAATNVDLARAVAERRFRDDLYYRLRVVPIELPPLRARREDLELLIRFLLRRIGRQRGRSLRLSPSAMRQLLAYAWPGNVRELENSLEYATAVCEGQTVHIDDLPIEVAQGAAPDGTSPGPRPVAELARTFDGLKATNHLREGRFEGSAERPEIQSPGWMTDLTAEEKSEAARIRAVLEETRYRRSEAAGILGMSRTTLWRKMRMYRLA